jgi:hypothetical protein
MNDPSYPRSVRRPAGNVPPSQRLCCEDEKHATRGGLRLSISKLTMNLHRPKEVQSV